MLWEETEQLVPHVVPDSIVDVVFQIQCRSLPLDHAYALSQAIRAQLPWFNEDAGCGLHLIHGAASGNGWERPRGEDDIIHLSRRTRLSLRVPQNWVGDAQELTGKTLDIDGHALTVGTAGVKALSKSSVLFARHVLAAGPEQGEEAFEQEVLAQLRQHGIKCRKILCGRSTYLKMPHGKLLTRSLMIADLSSEDAILLQQKGIGGGRAIGCGLFVPHKDIKTLSSAQVDELLAG